MSGPRQSSPRPRRIPWLFALLVGAALATSCGASGTGTDLTPPVEVPESYGGPVGDGGAFEAGRCGDFGDLTLESLQARAVRDNFDMLASWSRLSQADALARQAGAGRWPQLSAELSVSRGVTYVPPPLQAEARTTYIASLPAAYEVDLWGRIAETAEAADLDALAFRNDVEALAIGVTANVAEAWLDAVYQRAVQHLLSNQVETATTFLELTLLRLGQGQAAATDVLLQQQQIDGLEAQLELAIGGESLAEQRLSVLLGQPPQQALSGERDALPEPPSLPPTGLPAELLARRPDLRAAQWRLEAADHRVAAAIADRLPTLRLSASLGLQSTNLTAIFEQILWNIAASLSAPLIDGGRRRAEVDRTESVRDERLYQFSQTLLTALLEVESALVSGAQQERHIERLEEQLAVSGENLNAEQERYRQGLGDYLRVLIALQSVQNVERAILDSQRRLLTFRVQLCRALGGDWTRALAAPTSGGE